MLIETNRTSVGSAVNNYDTSCSNRTKQAQSRYLLIKLIFILIVPLLILSGCSTAVRKTIVTPADLPPTSPRKVQAVKYTDKFNHSCQIIGGLLVSSDMKESSRVKFLKKEAAKVGADAVVGMYHNHHQEYCCPNMTGGLAVQLTDDSSNTISPEKDFIVAIFQSPLDAGDYSDHPSFVAQSAMADMGYFPVIMAPTVPKNDKDYLKQLNFNDIETYCGEKFDYVLKLDLFEILTGRSAAQTSEIKSSAALYSVKDNKLIWENNYTGEGRSNILGDGFLIPILTGGKMATIRAIDNTVSTLLSTLPEVESTIGCDGFVTAEACKK